MKRRDLLTRAALLMAASGAPFGVRPQMAQTGRDRLTDLSAVAAVTAMKDGSLSAEQYAHALLERADATKSLNAFRTLDHEAVLEAAHTADRERARGARLGLLHGLPIPVKDSVNTRALPTSNGTAALRDFRPKDDAPLMTSLFAQGAILMGKTNIHELSFGWTSNNVTYGPVKNPYDPTRIPGGSSGGSGAAVGARVAPLAVAEDTHGSIRIPATMCGLTGLRPTYGRYPGDGILPITNDKFDQAGPLARTVSDLVLFDSAVTGDATPLAQIDPRRVRIGIAPGFYFKNLDPEVERITANALERLRDAGVKIVKTDVPDALKLAPMVAGTIQICEVLPAMTAFMARYGGGISFADVLEGVAPNVRAIFDAVVLPPNAAPRKACEQALVQRERIKVAVHEHFAAHRMDALLYPPALVPPLLIGDYDEVDVAGTKLPLTTVMGRNTALGSCASLACLVLPAGLTTAGLPVGIELDALPGADRALLALGAALESILGTIPAPPSR